MKTEWRPYYGNACNINSKTCVGYNNQLQAQYGVEASQLAHIRTTLLGKSRLSVINLDLFLLKETLLPYLVRQSDSLPQLRMLKNLSPCRWISVGERGKGV
ncbi:hypothetical protein J6590_030169 [Homalodisca vitripennis]|nr:hypothetical protein J6590_030169 [Homalodisca vitripennis]